MSTVTAPAPAPEKRPRHTFADLYHERTHFEFIKHSRRWAILSGTLILISLLAFAIRGLNLGIDFEGGTQWQFTLRQGTKFSNGETVDAAAFARSWNRTAANKTGGEGYLMDDIQGYDDVFSGKATTMSGVAANGPGRL